MRHGRHFSYGTVVQLCVARNRRRLWSKRYKGVAKVTSRRARKGFDLKYNPDTHCSNTLCKGLDIIQYTDGTNILNLNRDDMSVFRLDTMCTSNEIPTLSLKDKPVVTTKTDYQPGYKSNLQTTSYNFTGTCNIGERCIGIVKACAVHPKNPAQHSADLDNIESLIEFKNVFKNPLTGEEKTIHV